MNEIIQTYTNTNGVLIYYGDDYIYDALGITKYIAITVLLSSVPQGNIQSVEGACKYHTFNVRNKKKPTVHQRRTLQTDHNTHEYKHYQQVTQRLHVRDTLIG